MIRRHYPALFQDDARLERVEAFCDKAFELTVFLHDMLQWQAPRNCDFSRQSLTYHDSCAGLRELGIKGQPRTLLKQCSNVAVTEMSDYQNDISVYLMHPSPKVSPVAGILGEV